MKLAWGASLRAALPNVCLAAGICRLFAKHFSALIQRFGMTTRVAPAEAPWQNAMCERHGGVLAEIMAASIASAQAEGAAEMEICGFAAASAKNRRPDRTGYSAHGRVFGREEKWPGAAFYHALDGEWLTELQGATGAGDRVCRRAMQICLAAQDAGKIGAEPVAQLGETPRGSPGRPQGETPGRPQGDPRGYLF